MATINDIDKFFKRLENDFTRKAVSRIIAEKAAEFYKQKFTSKEWEGVPWQQTKSTVKRGSLMVRSGKLVNSIKPSVVTSERVKISAGSAKVPYAKAHNEGETIQIPVTEKMRKFAWAKYYEQAGKGVKTGKAGNVYQSIDAGKSASPWKGLALTKKQTLTVKMPKRQYMGHSNKLNAILMDSFRKAFKQLFK